MLLVLLSFCSYVIIVSLLKQARWGNYRMLKKCSYVINVSLLNYVRFMYFLLCFHVFHFLLVMILISLLNQVGWSKCI